MGVDAVIRVVVNDPLDAVAMRQVSADLVEAFGERHFWLWRPGEYDAYPDGRHAINAVEPDDGDFGLSGAQVLDVNVSSRYYGPGYERGNWPLIDGVCQWLGLRLPAAQVFYGGDSGSELALVTPEFREFMWRHFTAVGHTPYREMFTYEVGKRCCAFCADRPMEHYGFGGGGLYAAWRCGGCGLDEVTRDGGLTWMLKKDAETLRAASAPLDN